MLSGRNRNKRKSGFESRCGNVTAVGSAAVRFLMFAFAFFLLPTAAALVRAFLKITVIHTSGNTILSLEPGIALFIIGILLYAVLYLAGVRPTRLYVIGHELTHGLFGILHGARIGRMKVEDEHGSIRLSKAHVLTILAPYFFPFYMAVAIAAAALISIAVPIDVFRLPLSLILGMTWGFHFCYTVNGLMQPQTDIESCGYLFSYTIIIILNTAVLTAAAVMTTPCTYSAFADIFGDEIYFAYLNVCRNVTAFHDWLYSLP